MLFGFVLPGYEFDADLDEMELSGGEATPDAINDKETRSASAAPTDA